MSEATHTAPSFIPGFDRLRVKLLGKPRKSTVLVEWLQGPLRGREVRLCTKTLVKEKS
jgi:hypothetical protein